MATPIKLDSASAYTAINDSAASAGNNSFTSLVTGSAVLSGTSNFDGAGVPSSIDNSSTGARGGDMWMDLALALKLSTTSGVASNPTMDVYLLPREDGTNYADGTAGSSPVLLTGAYIGSFPVRSTTNVQYCAPLKGIPLPPFKCQLQVVNSTGVTLAAQNGGSALTVVTYRPTSG